MKFGIGCNIPFATFRFLRRANESGPPPTVTVTPAGISSATSTGTTGRTQNHAFAPVGVVSATEADPIGGSATNTQFGVTGLASATSVGATGVVEFTFEENTAYIRNTGTGSGTSWADAAPISALNTLIAQVGAGGTVYIRADEGDYTSMPSITINNGGAVGNPVTIRGVNVALAPMKAVLRGSRTSPWPIKAIGASTGGRMFTFAAGASNLTFQSLVLRDCKNAIIIGDQCNNITFGNSAYRDTAVAALLPANRKFDRTSPTYFSTIESIYSASAAGVSPDIQVYAVDMFNVYRGLDTGDPSVATTTDTLNNFSVYGGTYGSPSAPEQACGRGWMRFRGQGRGIWLQDVTANGGGLDYYSEDGFFCTGIEFNSPNNAIVGNGVSEVVLLRVTSNNHRDASDRAGYTNGDGVAGERGNDAHMFIRCTANGNEDGGLETKATNCTVIGVNTSGNRRNLRFWGDSDIFHAISSDPTNENRNAYSTCHVYSCGSFGWVRVFSGVLSNTGEISNIANGENVEGNPISRAYIAISTDVQIITNLPQGSWFRMAATRGYVGLFDPNDTTPPTFVTSGTRTVVDGGTDVYDATLNPAYAFPIVYGNDPTNSPDIGAFVSARNTQDNYAAWEPFDIGPVSYDSPADANGDRVYKYRITARTPTYATATQDVTLTILPLTGSVNLLSSTETFNNWGMSNATVSANVAQSPLSSAVTADKMIANTVSANHNLDAPVVTVTTGAAHTFSVYAKADGLLGIQIRANAATNGTAYSNYDLVNGALGSGSGTANRVITSVGNGWYRCSCSFSPNASPATFVITLINSATAGRAPVFVGDGTSGVLLFGAMLQVGTSLSAYATASP